MKIIEKEVLSSDKKHRLNGVVYLPDGEAKGLFHVVHGMTEYIGRYDAFMRTLAENGWIAFGYDHLGHGKTVADSSELGFIAKKDGWKLLIDDVFLFGETMRGEYGAAGMPFILMGHSMGSFIVRLAAAKYNHYDKLIVMGTGGPNPAAGAGIAVAGMLKAFRKDSACSDLIYSMAFGTYNKGFEDENDKYAWLSVDRKNRDEYRQDPLCTFMFTISAMQDLIRLNKYSNDKAWFDGIDKQKPILLVSGSEDPVGEHSKGVTKVYDLLKEAGADVTMKLYDGYRHELLKDFCGDEVTEDILRFIG